MNRKLKPPKPPKFKRKEYKVPDDLKYVVVTNPWSRPPTESVPEYMKERFANAIGGWFERMTGGKRDLAIYFVRTQSLIIVELSNFDNLAIILGAHHTRDFSTNPTLDVISEIYEYDYKHHGSPRSILQWTSITPQYTYRDLERLPLKRDYPPPRVPQSNRPPQFAVGLSEDVRDMIGARRVAHEENLAKFQPPPPPPAPHPSSSMFSSAPGVPPLPAENAPERDHSHVPYQSPAMLAYKRQHRNDPEGPPVDPRIRSHPQPPREESNGGHTIPEANTEASPEVSIKHDPESDHRREPISNLKLQSGSLNLNQQGSGAIQTVPKKEEDITNYLSPEYIRSYHEHHENMQRSNTLNANKVVGADTGRGTEMLQFTAIKPDPEADNLRGLVATQSHSYNTMEHDLKPKLRDSSSPAPVVPKKEEHHPFSPENIRFFHEFHSQNALAQIQNSNVSSVTATIEAESIKSEPESYYGSPSSIDLQPNTATTRHPSRSITRHLDEHEHDVKPKLEELAHHSRLTAPRQEKTLQSYDRAGEPHHQSQMNGKLYDRSSSYIDRGVPPDPRHHVVKHERDTDEDDLGERPGMRMYSNGDSGSLSRSDRFHVGLHGDTKRVKTEHS